MRILAVSGSLNSRSSNTRLLRTLRDAASPGLEIVLYESLDTVPPFSPDRDTDPAPAPVSALRTMVGAADALLFATPEYAGGMPGTLKNALDWLVGSGELYGKPVVIMSAAPSENRGHNARQSLELTLRMQGARVCDSFTVPVAPQSPDESLAAERVGVLARTMKAFVEGPCTTAV
jgi:NAD(P)H-dependent FMN reductase